jgi:hypothetical protein
MKRNYTSLVDSLNHYLKKYQVEKREDILKVFENLDDSLRINKPKYIYLNTLKIENKKEIAEHLKADNFRRIKWKEDNNDLRTALTNIKKDEYVKDEHIKNLLIFSSDSLLNKNHSLFVEGHLLQIDKVRGFKHIFL